MTASKAITTLSIYSVGLVLYTFDLLRKHVVQPISSATDLVWGWIQDNIFHAMMINVVNLFWDFVPHWLGAIISQNPFRQLNLHVRTVVLQHIRMVFVRIYQTNVRLSNLQVVPFTYIRVVVVDIRVFLESYLPVFVIDYLNWIRSKLVGMGLVENPPLSSEVAAG